MFIFAPIGVVCLVREFWINTTRSLYISDVLPAYAVLTACLVAMCVVVMSRSVRLSVLTFFEAILVSYVPYRMTLAYASNLPMVCALWFAWSMVAAWWLYRIHKTTV